MRFGRYHEAIKMSYAKVDELEVPDTSQEGLELYG